MRSRQPRELSLRSETKFSVTLGIKPIGKKFGSAIKFLAMSSIITCIIACQIEAACSNDKFLGYKTDLEKKVKLTPIPSPLISDIKINTWLVCGKKTIFGEKIYYCAPVDCPKNHNWYLLEGSEEMRSMQKILSKL